MRDLRELLTPGVLERCRLAWLTRPRPAQTRAAIEEFIKVLEERESAQQGMRAALEAAAKVAEEPLPSPPYEWSWVGDHDAGPEQIIISPGYEQAVTALEAAVIETIVTKPIPGNRWKVCLCSWGLGRQHFRPQCEGADG